MIISLTTPASVIQAPPAVSSLTIFSNRIDIEVGTIQIAINDGQGNVVPDQAVLQPSTLAAIRNDILARINVKYATTSAVTAP